MNKIVSPKNKNKLLPYMSRVFYTVYMDKMNDMNLKYIIIHCSYDWTNNK